MLDEARVVGWVNLSVLGGEWVSFRVWEWVMTSVGECGLGIPGCLGKQGIFWMGIEEGGWILWEKR